MIILIFVILLNIYIIHDIIQTRAKFLTAETVIDNICQMHALKIISDIQARVYLNELDNPLNTQAVLAVNKELQEIYEKHQNSN